MVKYGGNGYGASSQQNSCSNLLDNLDMEKHSTSRGPSIQQEGWPETGRKIGINLPGSCESRSHILPFRSGVRIHQAEVEDPGRTVRVG